MILGGRGLVLVIWRADGRKQQGEHTQPHHDRAGLALEEQVNDRQSSVQFGGEAPLG
jgi:hypothetical protein